MDQVGAEVESGVPPGRRQMVLPRRRQTVFEELSGHTLSLPKNDFSGGADHKSSVVKIRVRRRIYRGSDQVALAIAAPTLDFLRDGSVESVFAEHQQVGLRRHLEQMVERGHYFALGGKLQLDTGDRKARLQSRRAWAEQKAQAGDKGEEGHRNCADTEVREIHAFTRQCNHHSCRHSEEARSIHAQPVKGWQQRVVWEHITDV